MVFCDDQLMDSVVMPGTSKQISDSASVDNSNVNIDSLFDQEGTVLLTKRMEDDKCVVRVYPVACGSALVISNSGAIQNIKKTTIISPKLDSNANIFVRELDKSDLSMDKAIHILTLLQEKIEELSTKDLNYFNELTSRILLETRANVDNKKTPLVDAIDKNKIIEQVLLQKTEIEKLQRQQSELISLLSNQQMIFPLEPEPGSTTVASAKLISSSEQDIVNAHKAATAAAGKHYPSPYSQQFVNQSQLVLNSADPRLFLPNSVYMNPDELEYQNSNSFLMDNAIRNQIVHMKTPLSENIMYNAGLPASKDFVAIDNSMRLKGMKEMGGTLGDGARGGGGATGGTGYGEIASACYPNDYFDRSLYQHLHYHANEQIPDNELHCKMNPVSSVPNIQERISDFIAPDNGMSQQMYQSKYPFYYQLPYQNIRSDHGAFLQEKPMVQNYMVPPSFYDASKMVAQQYPTAAAAAAAADENLRKDQQQQLLYDHGVGPDELKMSDQVLSDQTIFSVTNAFLAAAAAADSTNLSYHENNFSISNNQKSADKAPDACINIQMNNECP